MIPSGIKVSLEISEPWDAYRILTGAINRTIRADRYFVIRDDNKRDDLYIVACRYEGDQLSDILKGKEVHVGIAIPQPGLDILNVPEINEDALRRLDYAFYGVLRLIADRG